MSNETEYSPTLGEKKILEALKNPDNYTVTISELCKSAGVSRNTYYEACKRPEFVTAKNEVLNKVFNSLVPEVKKAAMRFAIKEAKNFQDRKMILEMAGEYKQNITSTNINFNKEIEELSDEKLEEELKKLNGQKS